MSFIVVYDSCTLFSPCLRDLLIRIAGSGVVQAKWTDEILDECFRAIGGLQLPDPDDRHVLAAAIRAGAQSIVTDNDRDFPAQALKPYCIEAMSPDEFVTDILDLAPSRVVRVLCEQAAALRNPPRTVPDLLSSLRKCGLKESVAKFHELWERLGD